MSKKLLFIIPIFPKSKSDDTIVPFIAQFCDYFSKKNHDVSVHIVSLNYPFYKKKYNYGKCVVYTMGNGFNSKFLFLPYFFYNLFHIIKFFKKNRYDGILSFWYSHAALTGNVLSFLFKVPHYTWMQGQDVKSNNLYLKYLKPNPARLILAGKKHKDSLIKEHGINSKHIANVAIVTQNFPPLNKKERTIDIIGVGNLGKLKNYERFIDVVYKLKKTNPKIKTLICGDGEERKNLELKIKNLDLINNVELKGYISNTDVRKLLNNTKVMLHTSSFEGSGYAMQEALFSGCKVVATYNSLDNHIPNLYYIDNNNDIVKKIQKLIEHKTTPERIVAYNINDTVKTIYNLFFEIDSNTS